MTIPAPPGFAISVVGITGFVQTGDDGAFLEAPYDNVTNPTGVNDLGEIVGDYVDLNGAAGVFLATRQSKVLPGAVSARRTSRP